MATKNDDVLSGMEAIARYMDVSQRTVIRWEAAHGLPLMRPAGVAKVYAYKSKLELWRSGKLKNDGDLMQNA